MNRIPAIYNTNKFQQKNGNRIPDFGFRILEGIRELETPAVIDAINTGGKHCSMCPRQPLLVILNEQGLNKTLAW
jgi:hypothetical protein